MINKKFLKQFVREQNAFSRIDLVLAISEQRSRGILAKNSWYKELYVDPNVDIINSHPQVHQQVRQELYDFLSLLSSSFFSMPKLARAALTIVKSVPIC